MTDPSPAPALPRDFLRPCLLLLLREKPAHGYDLIDSAHALGIAVADPGGVYRALRGLEQEGLVRSYWEPSDSGPQRRVYELTRAGMEELHLRAKAIAAAGRYLDAFLSRYQEFVALNPTPRARARGGGGRGRHPAPRS